MPVEKDTEVKFNFGNSDFSASSAQQVDLEGFLTDDQTVTPITKTKPAKKQEVKTKTEQGETEEEDDETEGKEKDKKPAPKLKIESDELFQDDEETQDESDDKEDKEEEELEVFKSKKKKEPEKKPGEKKSEEVEDESPYSSLAKDLFSLGVFTPDEDEEGNEVTPEIKSGEDFLKTFQSEVRKQTGASIEKYLERFGPEYSDMFEAVFVNGVPPSEYITRQTKIDNIADFDTSTEENQEKIVRQWYKLEGRSAEAIDAKIQKLKNYSDLGEEAEEAKKVLVTKEQQNLANLAAQKQQELKNKQRIKGEYVSNVGKIINDRFKAKEFDGIPIDKKFAEQTYAYLTKDAYTTKDNQLLTEFDKDILDLNRPENHSTKVKLAMLLQMIKTDPTLSKLSKKAVSKESNKLFQQVESKFGKSKQVAPKREEEDDASLSNW